MSNTAICPYCKKPVGQVLKNAKISHLACLHKQLAQARKRVPSDYGKKNVLSSKHNESDGTKATSHKRKKRSKKPDVNGI